MNIIGREETVLSLFSAEDGTLGKLTLGIMTAVGESFSQQSMNNPTDAEVRDRFNKCMKWAKILRGDLKWGIQRINDELKNALRAELLGTKYEPPTRECWIPSDGA